MIRKTTAITLSLVYSICAHATIECSAKPTDRINKVLCTFSCTQSGPSGNKVYSGNAGPTVSRLRADYGDVTFGLDTNQTLNMYKSPNNTTPDYTMPLAANMWPTKTIPVGDVGWGHVGDSYGPAQCRIAVWNNNPAVTDIFVPRGTTFSVAIVALVGQYIDYAHANDDIHVVVAEPPTCVTAPPATVPFGNVTVPSSASILSKTSTPITITTSCSGTTGPQATLTTVIKGVTGSIQGVDKPQMLATNKASTYVIGHYGTYNSFDNYCKAGSWPGMSNTSVVDWSGSSTNRAYSSVDTAATINQQFQFGLCYDPLFSSSGGPTGGVTGDGTATATYTTTVN